MPEPLAPTELAARRRRGTELVRSGEQPDAEVAVLSTFNLDLLTAFLAEALDRHALPARVRMAGFGQLAAQIADPGSELYGGAPRDVVLVPAPEDVLGPLFAGEPHPDPLALADDAVAELEGQVATVLDRLPDATVAVVAFGARRAPAEHVLTPDAPDRGQAALERFDAGVRALAGTSARVVVVDWAWAVREHGWAAVSDARLWYLGRMRLNPTGNALLADLVAGRLAARRGVGRRKVAAIDLDDTLWGGVVGETGVGGLQVGGEGAGLAFQDVQRELLRLHAGGVLLVMCTKNERDDALSGFEHPAMLLRREHFVAERINWQDKAANLRELAEELNVGIDAFVFLDDNPREREWVRQALPEVVVPELPADPADRPAFVAALPWFQTVAVTEDDRRRAQSYHAQGERRRAQTSSGSFEDYLASLEQRVTIEPVGEPTLPRAAQLCQKTNQFNLTSRRHTQGDLERMLADPAYDLLTVGVADRFGDSGITGVAIVRDEGERSEVDTLLLSCRVLGRRVEDALLAVVARRARERGARSLHGRFVATQRNAQVATFYPDRGFAPEGEGAWSLSLEDGELAVPPQIDVQEAARA